MADPDRFSECDTGVGPNIGTDSAGAFGLVAGNFSGISGNVNGSAVGSVEGVNDESFRNVSFALLLITGTLNVVSGAVLTGSTGGMFNGVPGC